MSLIDTQSQLKSSAKPVAIDLHADSQSPLPVTSSFQSKDSVTQHSSRFRRLAPATALGVAWSLFPSIAGVILLLNMEPIAIALIGDTGSSSQFVIGLGMYTVCFIILAGFGFLPTISQAVLAGYTFGFALGLPAAMIGFAGASLIGYEVVKHLARDRIEQELDRSPKTSMVRHALLTASPKRAILIVSLLRASPSAPFALTNLVLVSLGVSRFVFLIGTILGMFPRTLGAVLIGVSITNWTGEYNQPHWLIVGGITATIVLLVVVSRTAASTLKKLSIAE